MTFQPGDRVRHPDYGLGTLKRNVRDGQGRVWAHYVLFDAEATQRFVSTVKPAQSNTARAGP